MDSTSASQFAEKLLEAVDEYPRQGIGSTPVLHELVEALGPVIEGSQEGERFEGFVRTTLEALIAYAKEEGDDGLARILEWQRGRIAMMHFGARAAPKTSEEEKPHQADNTTQSIAEALREELTARLAVRNDSSKGKA